MSAATSAGGPAARSDRLPGRGRRRRWWIVAVVVTVLLVVPGAAVGVAYGRSGWYGVNVLLRRGANFWVTVEPDDDRLTPGMRLALAGRTTPDPSPAVEWRTVAPGFEVGRLPVRVAGQVVDELLLSRVDPARHRFRVLNRPAGDRDIGDWMDATGARLVVNGSYYAPRGLPATPVVSDGRRLGPQAYEATHGAFVSGASGTELVDLTGRDWRNVTAGADAAMVNYPMLLGADGSSRAGATNPRWLANRSFLGQDGAGRIIVATTTDAYFSLPSLAAFLPRSGLDLELALNLDGGPVACQAVATAHYDSTFCGSHELAVRDGGVQLLRPLVDWRLSGLPIVLAVVPDEGHT